MKKTTPKTYTYDDATYLKKKIRSPKTWIFLILTLIAYGLIVFRLFGQFLAIESMIYVMLFFLFFHFFYLEVRKLPIKYLALVMVSLTVIEGFFIGYSHILLVASMFAINAGIVYLARLLQGASNEKIIRDTVSYITTGGYMFTVFITIAYSLFVLGYYEKFPFTCEYLSEKSSRVINTFTKPLTSSVDSIKSNTDSIFNTKVGDIAAIGETISLKSTASSSSNIIQNINTYKKNFIDQAVQDNTTVNMGICDYLLGKVNEIYENPAFKASVILLMFLIFYGFIRIEFWIMTGLARVIFKILFAFKAYRIKKVMRETEEIE